MGHPGRRSCPMMGPTEPPNRPSVNPDVNYIADEAKHTFAVCTRKLADMQFRLAELAGTDQLDAEESMNLQDNLFEIWEELYRGTLFAVRDWTIDDCTADEAGNTYSDGRRVVTQVRVEPWEESDACWLHNPFLLGDGAPDEFPLGTISFIAMPPSEFGAPPFDPGELSDLRARLDRHHPSRGLIQREVDSDRHSTSEEAGDESGADSSGQEV